MAWLAAGHISSDRARRYNARVNRLARVLGRTYGDVYAEILADAKGILEG